MNIHSRSLVFPRSSKRSLSFNVSLKFRSKERGTRVKHRVKNGATNRAGRGGEERKETAFASFPSPPSFFRSRSIFRAAKTGNLVLRSFFAAKPGNACYTGYKVSCYEGPRSRVTVGVKIRVRLGVRVRIRVRERRKAKGKIRKIAWCDFNIVSVRLSCRQLGFPGLLGQCISVTYLK